jgi:hypothetical protein
MASPRFTAPVTEHSGGSAYGLPMAIAGFIVLLAILYMLLSRQRRDEREKPSLFDKPYSSRM